MTLCKDCKWWVSPPEYEEAWKSTDGRDFGDCTCKKLDDAYGGYIKWDKDSEPQKIPTPDQVLMCLDSAWQTGPDFGCIHGEPR